MENKNNNLKKILKIKNGEYLLDIKNGSVLTTYNKNVAMDINDWSLEQLGFICENLKKVGYIGVEVLVVEEVIDVIVKNVENVFDSANKIDKAINKTLKDVGLQEVDKNV